MMAKKQDLRPGWAGAVAAAALVAGGWLAAAADEEDSQFDWYHRGPELPKVEQALPATTAPALPSQLADPLDSVDARPSPPGQASEYRAAQSGTVRRLPPLPSSTVAAQRASIAPAVAENRSSRSDDPVAIPAPPTPDAHEESDDTADPAAETIAAESPEAPGANAAVEARADELVRSAFRLADRRMYFSARQEFVAALETVARARDADDPDTDATGTLAAGLRALEESEDFVPRGAALDADVDVQLIVAGHQTRALKDAEVASVTPLDALKSYYTYAQERLASSTGGSPAAATALYGLGKLHAHLAADASSGVVEAEAKRVVFLQAALLANPKHHLAANELGVTLARNGRWEEARAWLKHSVGVRPTPEAWRNLAIVHQRLGEGSPSQEAWRRSQTASPGAASTTNVQWVAPAAFVGPKPSGEFSQPSQPAPASASRQEPGRRRDWSWLTPWK